MCEHDCVNKGVKCLCYLLDRVEQLEADILNSDANRKPVSMSYNEATGTLTVRFTNGEVKSVDLPTIFNTSDLINDGEVGISRFVEEDELARVAFTGDFNDLINTVEGDKHYVHDQGNPSAYWICYHNLGKFPSVQVIDSAGSLIMGHTNHIDTNTVALTFSGMFSGTATFN